MKLGGIVILCIVLAGCAVSSERARQASDRSLCRMSITGASILTVEVREEINRRGIDCGDYAREISEDSRRAIERRSMERSADLANSARQAEQLTILCGYCAKVFPQEIFGRCKGVNSHTCGALWNDGKKGETQVDPPHYGCRKYGDRMDCTPY